MSRTTGAYAERSTYQGLDRSTVGEIQKKIGKRGKQSAVSRLLHAKKDKDTIATWRRDLKRILQIFNVRSAGPAWQ